MSPKVALVTGAAGGIGAAIARRLSLAGLLVVITDMESGPLEDVSESLGIVSITADLGRREDVRALVAQVEAEHGAPSILVSAAGGVRGQTARPVEEVPEDDWRSIFAANVDSAFFLSQAVAPAMREAGWGRIVTISSGAGLRPSLTGIQAYAAAKHALVGLTRQLSLELAPGGTTVNSVAPGFVLSNDATRRQWDAYGPEGQAALVERIHTRRLGTPDDIASAAAFLASDEAGWITGQVLSVDGGVS